MNPDYRVPIPIINIGVSTAPPFAALAIDSLYQSGKASNSKFTDGSFFAVRQPSASVGTPRGPDAPSCIVFNGNEECRPVDFGAAYLQPINLVLFDTSDGDVSPGEECGPVDGSYAFSKNGRGFRMFSYDNNDSYIAGDIRTVFVTRGTDDCGKFFQYQLLTDWYGGLAIAYKRTMDGGTATDPLYVTVRDPLGIFSYQRAGSKGYMVKECGKYYAIQAPCDNLNAPTPPNPGDTGACCISLSGSWVCEDLTDDECAALGGIFQGTSTTCATLPLDCSELGEGS